MILNAQFLNLRSGWTTFRWLSKTQFFKVHLPLESATMLSVRVNFALMKQGIPVGEELKILSLIEKLAIIDKTGVMGHSRYVYSGIV